MTADVARSGGDCALVVHDRRSTSKLLACMGGIRARRLLRMLGHPSMYSYCVHELHMSEDMAWKRISVASLARRFPVVLDMIAGGRLHLTAGVRLCPHRHSKEFPRLLEAATHKTKTEIELLLAECFPRPDVPTEVRPLVKSGGCQKLVPEPVVRTHVPRDTACEAVVGQGVTGSPGSSLADSPDVLPRPEPATERQVTPPEMPPPPRARVEPLAPQRFAIQVTVGQATHDKLRRARHGSARRRANVTSRPT